MSITNKILELDPSLELHIEGKWNEPYAGESGYTSFNDAGVECETGELLYGFVRALRPELILETGTHWGIGSAYLGMGLKDNKQGKLITLEFLPEIRERAKERFTKLGLNDWIISYLVDARQFEPENTLDQKFDLILLDTEPQTRFGELIKYYEYLKPGGYVFIHDLHRHMHQIPTPDHQESPYNGECWPYGRLDDTIKEWVRKGKLRPFHFPTPRGLTGFYKTHQSDYDWSRDT